MEAIKILSCGGYLPNKTLTNKELEVLLDTTDNWISQMTGIKERHILDDNENFIDCSCQAALTAINRGGISNQQIDLIIIATTTPYQLMPSSAAMVQRKLGIDNAIAFDMQAACSGFVYALSSAYYFMQANPDINYALVLGCDVFSKIIDKTDRATAILFGDGFGAFLLSRSPLDDGRGIFYCKLGSDGAGVEELQIPWGVGQGMQGMAKNKPYLQMNGKQVFKQAVERFSNEIQQALEFNKLTTTDIKYFIPHQANIRILKAIAHNLDIPMEKILISLDKHGNTSAASIPLAFNAAFQEGKIKKGDLILLSGFGAGYTWGTVLLEF
ncbi:MULTISPECIES: beta-ketoacyl-ACP synthase III [unclassified Legionella]|uniref:beta-ketoacyl-ACP synthase III n=1 Tax=unclassified Legionella TaxID=2622702 RepID=UPI001056979A|nr:MULTISPECIES: beta-ketoacyl-ACP synthase III [unclassified Legionella]MDI9819206.1 beta-ketoacyl-ACP synthase III [Legionella sp. PL877]